MAFNQHLSDTALIKENIIISLFHHHINVIFNSFSWNWNNYHTALNHAIIIFMTMTIIFILARFYLFYVCIVLSFVRQPV